MEILINPEEMLVDHDGGGDGGGSAVADGL